MARSREVKEIVLGLKSERVVDLPRKTSDLRVTEGSWGYGKGKPPFSSSENDSGRSSYDSGKNLKCFSSELSPIASKKSKFEAQKIEGITSSKSPRSNNAKAKEPTEAKLDVIVKSSPPKNGQEALHLLQKWNLAHLFVPFFTGFSTNSSALVDSAEMWFPALWKEYPHEPSFPIGSMIEGRLACFFIMSCWQDLASTMARLVQTADPSASLLEKYSFDIAVPRLAIEHLISERICLAKASLKSLEDLVSPGDEATRVEEALEDINEKIEELQSQLKEFEAEKLLVQGGLDKLSSQKTTYQ